MTPWLLTAAAEQGQKAGAEGGGYWLSMNLMLSDVRQR